MKLKYPNFHFIKKIMWGKKMSEKKYSKQHEWVSIEGDIATVGITKHAAEMLGDVVFVELQRKEKMLKKKDRLES